MLNHLKHNYENLIFISEWPVSGRTLAAVGTGVTAVVATPLLIAGAGFTAAGVAAGSLAAMLQVYRLENIKYNLIFQLIFLF